MDLWITLVVAVLAIASALAVYKIKGHTAFPASQPTLALLPKYAFSISLPAEISMAPDPIEKLGSLLAEYGFRESKRSDKIVVYSRGSLLGDFSVEITKLNLEISLPLAAESAARVEYGAFAAFDTGDLWRFSDELTRKLCGSA